MEMEGPGLEVGGTRRCGSKAGEVGRGPSSGAWIAGVTGTAAVLSRCLELYKQLPASPGR